MFGVDQIGDDAHAVVGLLHAALQHQSATSRRAADFAHRFGRPARASTSAAPRGDPGRRSSRLLMSSARPSRKCSPCGPASPTISNGSTATDDGFARIRRRAVPLDQCARASTARGRRAAPTPSGSDRPGACASSLSTIRSSCSGMAAARDGAPADAAAPGSARSSSCLRRGLERPRAGRHLVQHGAERKQVAAVVHRVAVRRTARAPCSGSCRRRRPRSSRSSDQVVAVLERRKVLRQSEVEQLHEPAGGQEDVARRDVAMHDAVVVGRAERVRHLAGDVDDLVERQGPRASRAFRLRARGAAPSR